MFVILPAPRPGINLVIKLFFLSFMMEPGLLLLAAPPLPATDEELANEFCLASLIGTLLFVAVGVSSNEVVSLDAVELFAAVFLLLTVVSLNIMILITDVFYDYS